MLGIKVVEDPKASNIVGLLVAGFTFVFVVTPYLLARANQGEAFAKQFYLAASVLAQTGTA